MYIPKLKIGNITADIPIVQGGMGVRISLSSLASAVANEGGIGTISSFGLGDIEDSKTEYERISEEALIKEISRAKSLTNGHLAVNVMGALSNYGGLVKTAVREGIKIIVFGAGLPFKLPGLVEDTDINLVPIISSARAARLILHKWDNHYGRTADAFILEGPLAGGHLGFSGEQLTHIDDFSLEKLLPEVLETVKPFEDKYGKKIPIIAAGGIYNGKDIARMLALGASGIQMGTRFVCTAECDASIHFKQAYLDCKKEDIVIIQSPVGMPGRAIRNRFLMQLDIQERFKILCHYKCLTVCKVKDARYCIYKVLINSYLGDTDNGIIFCGQNAYRINEIVTVNELIKELLSELSLVPQ